MRALLAASLALGLLAAPSALVLACTCAFLGGTVDVANQAIANSDVAFIGTVVDTAPSPAGIGGSGSTVRYAFAVERATVPVAEIIEVHALDDGGGASCGFTFAVGETWFVATYEQDGALHTGLCSGNTELATLHDDERDQIASMLTAAPMPASDPELPWQDWLPITGIVAAVLTIGGFMAVAFRRAGRF